MKSPAFHIEKLESGPFVTLVLALASSSWRRLYSAVSPFTTNVSAEPFVNLMSNSTHVYNADQTAARNTVDAIAKVNGETVYPIA